MGGGSGDGAEAGGVGKTFVEDGALGLFAEEPGGGNEAGGMEVAGQQIAVPEGEELAS